MALGSALLFGTALPVALPSAADRQIFIIEVAWKLFASFNCTACAESKTFFIFEI